MGPARGAGTADVVVEIVESTLPKVGAVRQKLVAALQRVVGSGIHYYLKYYFSAVPSTGGGALSLASAALVRNYLVLEVAAPYSSDFFFFFAACATGSCTGGLVGDSPTGPVLISETAFLQ